MNKGNTDSERPQCDPLASSPPISIKDKQLKATSYLKEVASRMVNVSIELQDIHRVFSARKGLSRTEKSLLSSLRQTIIPFVDEVSQQVNASSKVLSPIGGLDYVHAREEINRKLMINQSRPRMRVKALL